MQDLPHSYVHVVIVSACYVRPFDLVAVCSSDEPCGDQEDLPLAVAGATLDQGLKYEAERITKQHLSISGWHSGETGQVRLTSARLFSMRLAKLHASARTTTTTTSDIHMYGRAYHFSATLRTPQPQHHPAVLPIPSSRRL